MTGYDGKLKNLPSFKDGTYTIVEMNAPAGYIKDPNPRVVTFKADGTGARQIKFDNYKMPGLKVYKVDAQDQLKGIPGTVFTVTYPGGREMDYTTGADGTFSIEGLEPGVYTIKEKSVPAPYILDPEPRRVELKIGDTQVPVYFVDYPQPGFRLFKIDSLTGAGIPGVTFHIEGKGAENSHISLDLTTGANGQILFDHLPEGVYEFTEILAPAGYIIDGRPQIIELKRSQNAMQDTKIMFSNTSQPTFEILKRDAKTGLPLPGASFKIARMGDSSHYLDRITDAQGKIALSGNDLMYLMDKPSSALQRDAGPKLVRTQLSAATRGRRRAT